MAGPARILVVDDEARIAEVVQNYLEGQGHRVSLRVLSRASPPVVVRILKLDTQQSLRLRSLRGVPIWSDEHERLQGDDGSH